MSGFNGTKQIIDIPAAGTLQDILLTGPADYVEIVESQLTSAGAANVPQGFQYKLPNDEFVRLFEKIPGQTLEIGDRQGHYKGRGSVLGNGPDTPGAGVPPRAATVVAKVQSLTATPTSVEVTQWYS